MGSTLVLRVGTFSPVPSVTASGVPGNTLAAIQAGADFLEHPHAHATFEFGEPAHAVSVEHLFHHEVLTPLDAILAGGAAALPAAWTRLRRRAE